MNIVIDTNILCKALIDISLKHLRLILNINTFNHFITLDHDDLLLGEYQRNLEQYPFYQKWYKEMVTQHQIFYCNHKIINRHAHNLSRLGFHGPIDCIIVGLADHADKYIVSEDSDFGKGNERRAAEYIPVLRYLNEQMGLTVHDVNEAINKLLH
jgi:predicted nucleic acid-binding protein